MPKTIEKPESQMRLDKWLWCARLFKTRGLAANAVKSGKVILNNTRTKPSKLIQYGDRISIRRGPLLFEITIQELSKIRKSASDALALYLETQESIELRKMIAMQLRTDNQIYTKSRGRPSKRNRRELIKFKEGK